MEACMDDLKLGKPSSRSPPTAGEPIYPKPERERRSPWLRLFLILLALLVIGGIAYRLYRQPAQPASGFRSAGPVPVGVATVGKGDINITLNALGTVTALSTVTVQSQVSGQLIDVAYREGQDVKRGDLLAQIDPRPFQAALDQAEGQLQKDQAILKEAQIDLARYTTLAAQNSIARQQAEDQVYVVQQDEGTVKVDEALVNTARINLGYCRITAPLNGHIGLRLVDPGNYVQSNNSTGLAVITQLQPIAVVFALPEDNLPAVQKRVHEGAQLPVTVFDRSGATKLGVGMLAAIDSAINTSTGTVNLKAQFANDDEVLFPNQFVNVTLLIDTMHDATVVASAAVQRGAPGTFVYLAQDDGTVAVHPIKLGPADGERVAVLDGLKVGDRVVTDGVDKLRDGTKVTVGDGAAPSAGNGTAGPSREHSKGTKPGTDPSGKSP
jgi:multidrug efflux system membrane fusion protein